MSSDRLAIERAMWAVDIKQRLTEYKYREHLNDYATIFTVTHPASPEWQVRIAVCSAHNQRNRVEINDAVFSYSFRGEKREHLLEVLAQDRQRFDLNVANAKAHEVSQAEWAQRQAAELAGLPDVPTVNFDIVRKGVYEGRYRVTLFPGHPLEHLTLEQVKTFYEFLRTLDATIPA